MIYFKINTLDLQFLYLPKKRRKALRPTRTLLFSSLYLLKRKEWFQVCHQSLILLVFIPSQLSVVKSCTPM